MDELVADAELVAVLLALAGARTGDAVAVRGAGRRVQRALLAMSGTADVVDAGARVVVAGGPAHVGVAAQLLAPGGRLVAVAPDERTARQVAAGAGLDVQHLVPHRDAVAWSGRLTSASPPAH